MTVSRLRIKWRIASLAVLLLLPGGMAAADVPWYPWADHTIVKPDQMLYIVNPNTNTVVVPFETKDQYVEIVGFIGGLQYDALWNTRLACVTAVESWLDWDQRGERITTDANDEWKHLAKGTGILSGSRELSPSPPGEPFLALAKSRLDATKVLTQITKFHNVETTKEFEVAAD